MSFIDIIINYPKQKSHEENLKNNRRHKIKPQTRQLLYLFS